MSKNIIARPKIKEKIRRHAYSKREKNKKDWQTKKGILLPIL